MRAARSLVYFALFFLALAVESLWFFPWNVTASCGLVSALFGFCSHASVRSVRRAQSDLRVWRREQARV